MSDVAPRDGKAAKIAGGRKLEIDPAWVKLQAEGFCWRVFQVRLPEGAALADLNEAPTLWRLVQASRSVALRKFDHVAIVAFDESWLVEAVVGAATALTVTLAGIRKTDMPARYDTLPQTEDFRVKWYGNGYAVERKRDGQRVSDVVPTVFEAERHMLNRYSRPAA